jgi:hypothetical protein
LFSECYCQANGSVDGVPPLLQNKEEDRKKQQKEASLMRIAECVLLLRR